MVARSAYIQLNYSPWLLGATIIGLLFSYALPPAGAITGLAAGAATPPAALAAGAGLAGWGLMSLTYLPTLRLYRLSPLRAPVLPLIALLYAAMTADSARRHYAGRGAEWKGRTDRTRLPCAPWQANQQQARSGRTSLRPAAGAATSSPTSSPAPRSRVTSSGSSPTAAAWMTTSCCARPGS
jgi:hypothetical protein